jgi:hypothetical protein
MHPTSEHLYEVNINKSEGRIDFMLIGGTLTLSFVFFHFLLT